ncbi:hypothetical protein Vi05172_g5142 [Venturia inaequalis]|nr:hypothetical protein Vi05172_g5142 [Venturia inaequalis]
MIFSEELGERLDASFCSRMGLASKPSIEISPAEVVAIGEGYESTVIAEVKAFLQEQGSKQLQHKQCYLLELLGASLVEHQAEPPVEMTEKKWT